MMKPLIIEFKSVVSDVFTEDGFRESIEAFLRALMHHSIGLSFLFIFKDHGLKPYIIVDHRSSVIVRELLNSFFPSFSFDQSFFIPFGQDFLAAKLWGFPCQKRNPLKSLSEFFSSNNLEGGYAVVVEPTKFSWFKRILLEMSLRNRIKDYNAPLLSPRSDKDFDDSQKDYFIDPEIQYLQEILRRVKTRRALKTTIYVFIPRKQKHLLNAVISILIGSLSGDDPFSVLKYKKMSIKKALLDLLSCRIRGKHAILLPDEASILISFPKDVLRIPIKSSPETVLPPTVEQGIFLGNIMRSGRITNLEYHIPLNVLKKHVCIFGATGYGKTNTCFNILIQLYKKYRIPFLIIAPVKKEYRVLMNIIPAMRIFTLGNENIAPFRLNPLEVPENVHVQSHIDALKAAFNAAFMLFAPMPYVLEQCIINVYQKKGWNLFTEEKGTIPTLDDLYQEIDEYTKKLGYDAELTNNIRAALKTRLRSLMVGSKGKMLRAKRSIPVDLLLKYPTLIELENIEDENEKAFLIALILGRIYERVRAMGETENLRVVIVIEEAHRILQNVGSQIPSIEGADARKAAVRYFSNMLAEIRAYGVGIIIVEQIPSKLVPDAIKNTSTKIVHRLLAMDDKEIVGATMRLNEEQKDALTSLDVGEAMVFTETHPYPFMIKVPDARKLYNIPKDIPSEDTIRSRIMRFIMKYLRETENNIRPMNELVRNINIENTHQKIIKVINRVGELFSSRERNVRRFLEIYKIAREKNDPRKVAYILLRPAVVAIGPLFCDLLAMKILHKLCEKASIEKSEFLQRIERAIIEDARRIRIGYYEKLIKNILSKEKNRILIENMFSRFLTRNDRDGFISSLYAKVQRFIRKEETILFLTMLLEKCDFLAVRDSLFYRQILDRLHEEKKVFR
ncbi:MAG: ATP-binding protein [Candidatus Njordarchaeales archaeon]